MVGDGADPVGVADRGAPELLHDQRHPAEATTARGPDRPRALGPPTRAAPACRRARWAIRGGPRDWVGSRAVPSEREPVSERPGRPAWPPRPAAEAPQADPQRHHRRGDRRDHRRHRLPGLRRQQQAGREVQGEHDDHHGRREGRRRQAAGPGERGGRQGRLPGQHQDDGQHPEVLVGPGHDHRHLQDLHGHGRDDRGHVRHRAGRQDRPR